MKNKKTTSPLVITLAISALCVSGRAAAGDAETSLREAFGSMQSTVQAGKAPRKALVEAVLVDRRHRLADQIRALEASIAEISAARQVSINEAKREFLKCELALSDDQVLGYARDIMAVETYVLRQNSAWNKLVAPCPWYFREGGVQSDMTRVISAQKLIDLKAATLKSVRDEAAAVEAQIAALARQR